MIGSTPPHIYSSDVRFLFFEVVLRLELDRLIPHVVDDEERPAQTQRARAAAAIQPRDAVLGVNLDTKNQKQTKLALRKTRASDFWI